MLRLRIFPVVRGIIVKFAVLKKDKCLACVWITLLLKVLLVISELIYISLILLLFSGVLLNCRRLLNFTKRYLFIIRNNKILRFYDDCYSLINNLFCLLIANSTASSFIPLTSPSLLFHPSAHSTNCEYTLYGLLYVLPIFFGVIIPSALLLHISQVVICIIIICITLQHSKLMHFYDFKQPAFSRPKLFLAFISNWIKGLEV